ncbi:MAG: YraN family protein [Actinomycetota bacterium]|nr:YraN family protein [Actinomycetota bacterium]
MVDPRRTLGAAGEAAVATWYEAHGYTVLDRNWRVRAGELDLVLARANTVVFCEVKTRTGDGFGMPFEAVTKTKQRRLRGLASEWLAARRVGARDLRFDVASVMPDGDSWTIDVLEAAF